MKPVFADAFFYIALLNERDEHHVRVTDYADGTQDFFFTTRWVLAEVANTFGKTSIRADASCFLHELETDPNVKIVGNSDELYRRGLAFYAARPDKDWSLTDCISFLVMKDELISDALTHDHHFSQAGFVPIFSESP